MAKGIIILPLSTYRTFVLIAAQSLGSSNRFHFGLRNAEVGNFPMGYALFEKSSFGSLNKSGFYTYGRSLENTL